MRPLHALLLLVVLAAALVFGLLFVDLPGGKSGAGPTAPEAASGAATEKSATAEAAVLEGAADAPTRAAHANEAPADASGSTAAGKPQDDGPVIGLSGRVVGPTGLPVAKAAVYAAAANGFDEMPLDAIDPEIATWLKRADALTDADGRFVVKPQARGKVRIAVRASGFAPSDSTVVPPVPGKDLVDIVLEASAVLVGRVVDTTGRPLAGAELTRQAPGSGGMMFWGGRQGAVLAKTDAQGGFRIDQLAAGPWKIGITSEDHPDKSESGETERPGQVVSGLEFVVEEGFEIQGRVTGAPPEVAPRLSVRASFRPAAQGELESAIQFGPGQSLGQDRRAKVGVDGSFTVRGCRRGANYRLVAREGERDLFGRVRTAPTQARAGDTGVVLPYKPETAIVFQAVDAQTGAPVTEMSVQAGFGWPMPLMGEDSRPIRRFPDGRVRFGNLPPRRQREGGFGGMGGPGGDGLTLHVEANGYQPFDRKDLVVAEGQDLDLGVVRLEHAPLVKVQVLEDATGVPIAGASVNLVEQESQRGGFAGARMMIRAGDDAEDDGPFFGPGAAQRAKTGADGRASVTSLPGRTATLRVRAKDRAPYTSEPIALPASDDVDQVVRLKTGGTVIAEVVDDKGAPVPGVGVEHESPGNEGGGFDFSPQGEALTDAAGRLAFEHLEPGAHRFKLRDGGNRAFSAGGRRAMVRRRSTGSDDEEEGWTSVTVSEASAETVRLVAPTRCTIVGRVTESGKALANALVSLQERGGDGPALAFMGGGPEGRTNSRGEYSIEGVQVGEWQVRVTHATRAMAYEGDTSLREGENKLDVDLPVAIVEGRVTDADRKPIAGVRVRAERAPASGESRRQALSYSVMMRAGDGEEPDISVGSTDSGPTVTTDAEGRFTLRGVQPDVDLVARASGKDLQPGKSGTFRVAPDQVKSGVEIVLNTGGSIEVAATRPGGGPTPGCMVHARPDGDEPDTSEPKVGVTGPNGIARLTGLKPGRWRVSLNVIGFGGGDPPEIPEQVIEVQAGKQSKVRFETPPP